MRLDFDSAVQVHVRTARDVWRRATVEEGFRRQAERIRDQQEKEKAEQESFDDAVDFVAIATITQMQVERMQDRLSVHDAAVIRALMDNREALDAVQAAIGEKLEQAYLLEDGRRVFKTRDGTRVFDEHGLELKPEDLDPESIEDFRPRWEDYQTDLEARLALEQERDELLDYQQRLDAAQARLEEGEVDPVAFADMEALLVEDVPDAVRRQLPSNEPAHLRVQPAEPAALAGCLAPGADPAAGAVWELR